MHGFGDVPALSPRTFFGQGDRTIPIRFLSLILLLALASCANPTVITHVYYDHSEIIDVFRYAAGGRDFLVEIRGNPTTAPKATFDGAVLAAMHGRHGGPPAKFTTVPSDQARKNYRIVFVFGPAEYAGERAACAGADGDPSSPTSGRVTMQAAFCHKERPLSSSRVKFGPISGPFDSLLAQAVGQATLSLVPYANPDYKQQNNPILIS